MHLKNRIDDAPRVVYLGLALFDLYTHTYIYKYEDAYIASQDSSQDFEPGLEPGPDNISLSRHFLTPASHMTYKKRSWFI